MAAKATIADVQNEGFVAGMFGVVTTFTTAGGIIDTLLTRASNWAQVKVTLANYTAATSGYVFDCILRAEVAYCSQALWQRRIAFIDGNASMDLSADKKSSLLDTARRRSEEAMTDAAYWIAEAQRLLGIDVQADVPGTGIATGIVETGMMPQTINTARNYGAAQ